MTPRRDLLERRVARPLLRWIVPAAAILLAAAGFGVSAESVPTTSTGARVTKSVPFARESIDEIRALAPSRSQAVPGEPVHPLSSDSKAIRCDGRSADRRWQGRPLRPLSSPSSPAPSAPALDSSFAGLGNPPHSEGDVIPPDTMGAAGPNHLVSILNSDFGVFDKATGRRASKESPCNRSGDPSERRRESRRISRSTRRSSTTSTAGGSSRSLSGEGAPRDPGS